MEVAAGKEAPPSREKCPCFAASNQSHGQSAMARAQHGVYVERRASCHVELATERATSLSSSKAQPRPRGTPRARFGIISISISIFPILKLKTTTTTTTTTTKSASSHKPAALLPAAVASLVPQHDQHDQHPHPRLISIHSNLNTQYHNTSYLINHHRSQRVAPQPEGSSAAISRSGLSAFWGFLRRRRQVA